MYQTLDSWHSPSPGQASLDEFFVNLLQWAPWKRSCCWLRSCLRSAARVEA